MTLIRHLPLFKMSLCLYIFVIFFFNLKDLNLAGNRNALKYFVVVPPVKEKFNQNITLFFNELMEIIFS